MKKFDHIKESAGLYKTVKKEILLLEVPTMQFLDRKSVV